MTVNHDVTGSSPVRSVDLLFSIFLGQYYFCKIMAVNLQDYLYQFFEDDWYDSVYKNGFLFSSGK